MHTYYYVIYVSHISVWLLLNTYTHNIMIADLLTPGYPSKLVVSIIMYNIIMVDMIPTVSLKCITTYIPRCMYW